MMGLGGLLMGHSSVMVVGLRLELDAGYATLGRDGLACQRSSRVAISSPTRIAAAVMISRFPA